MDYELYTGGPLKQYADRRIRVVGQPLSAMFSELGGRLAVCMSVEGQVILGIAERIDCYHAQDIATLVNAMAKADATVEFWGECLPGSPHCTSKNAGCLAAQDCHAPYLDIHGAQIAEYRYVLRMPETQDVKDINWSRA